MGAGVEPAAEVGDPPLSADLDGNSAAREPARVAPPPLPPTPSCVCTDISRDILNMRTPRGAGSTASASAPVWASLFAPAKLPRCPRCLRSAGGIALMIRQATAGAPLEQQCHEKQRGHAAPSCLHKDRLKAGTRQRDRWAYFAKCQNTSPHGLGIANTMHGTGIAVLSARRCVLEYEYSRVPWYVHVRVHVYSEYQVIMVLWLPVYCNTDEATDYRYRPVALYFLVLTSVHAVL